MLTRTNMITQRQIDSDGACIRNPLKQDTTRHHADLYLHARLAKRAFKHDNQ